MIDHHPDRKKLTSILCRGKAYFLILVTIYFLGFCFSTLPARADGFDTTKDNWAVLTGYGQSFPGWGETTERVHSVDLIPRYDHVIFDGIGSSWYRGYHSIFLELPVSVVVSPDFASMVGANFLAAYTFTAGEDWQPYLFGGGGPVYSFADIEGMGADFNGNYQFGVGLRHHWDMSHQMLIEVRFHHISNAGAEDPNVPLNSLKILIGFTF